MAITIEGLNTTATISPVFTSGTQNDVSNISAFARLRALADTQSINFQQNLLEDETYNNFVDNDLLSLNSQSLDILNGITPPTATDIVPTATTSAPVTPTSNDTLNATVQANLDEVATAQAADLAPDTTAAAALNLNSIQLTNLSSIINEFSNAPFNQETFNQIQNSLVAAGINPQQVSLQAVLQEAFSGALPNSYYDNRTRLRDETIEVEAA